MAARWVMGLLLTLADTSATAVMAQSSSPARAAAPKDLTLADATTRALVANLDLRVARADTGFAQAQLIGARLRPNPVAAAQFETTGDAKFGGLEGATTLSFTQDLQLWGLRENRIREATAEQQRVLYQWREAERVVRREVAATYRDLVYQQQRVVLLDSLARLTGRIAGAARLAFQQALGSELDARLSDALTQQASLDRDRAIREYEIERVGFAKLLGDPLSTTYRLSDSLPSAGLVFLVRRVAPAAEPFATVQFDLSEAGTDSLIQIALAGRPDVRAAESAVEVSAASLAVARSVARPSVAVGGLLSRSRDNFSLGTQAGSNVDNSFGVGVVVGLPFRNRNQGEIARAQFGSAAASVRLAGVRLGVERDVRVAAERVALAASQVETLRQAILPTSAAALQLAESAFSRGQIGIFQVLQVQRTYVEGTTGLLENLRQYAVALAELEAAVGQPVR